MSGIELGKAFVQIVPSAQGISGSITNVMKGESMQAGEKSGASFMASMAKGIAGATVAVTAATAAVGTAVLKTAADVAAYGDSIDKTSQKMGMSAQAYQEWAAVMEHSGTDIESLKASMKTMANAVESGNDAFERIGLSMADISQMSNEEIFAATISGLQNVENETERTYLAGQLLGRGATELGALLNMSAEETDEMRKRVHELGGVMSDEAVKASATFADNLQDMKTAFSGIKNSIGADLLPGLNQMMEGITSLVIGEEEATEKISAGFRSVISNVVKSVPELVSGVSTFAKGITSALPDLFNEGIEMVSSFAEGIAAKIPDLATQGMDALNGFIEGLINNTGSIISAGGDLLSGLITGISNAIPKLVSKIPTIIKTIVTGLANNLPKIADAGMKILQSLWNGIKNTVNWLSENWSTIMQDMWDAFSSVDWIGLGKTLIEKIGGGISAIASEVPGVLLSIATTAWEWFKNVDWIGLGQKAIELIKEGIQFLAENIPGKLKEIADKAWKWFKEVDWLGLGKTVITTIISGLAALFSKIGEKLKEIGKDAVEKVKNIDWLQLGKDIINGIISGVTNLGSKLWEKIKGVATGAKDEASKVSFKSVGEDWMNGLSAGIEAGRPTVVRKAQSTASSVYSTTKATLQEASPSKAAIKLGRWWSEGLAIGIEKAAVNVYDAIGNIGGSMDARMYNAVSPMAIAANAATISPAASIGGQGVIINNNITVDGAEDPENFASRLVRQLQLDMRSI